MEELLILIRSKLKRQILALLKDKPYSPILISKLLKKHLSSISRSIMELEQEDFVKCKNPNSDRWRFYEITEKGATTLKEAQRYL